MSIYIEMMKGAYIEDEGKLPENLEQQISKAILRFNKRMNFAYVWEMFDIYYEKSHLMYHRELDFPFPQFETEEQIEGYKNKMVDSYKRLKSQNTYSENTDYTSFDMEAANKIWFSYAGGWNNITRLKEYKYAFNSKYSSLVDREFRTLIKTLTSIGVTNIKSWFSYDGYWHDDPPRENGKWDIIRVDFHA